MNDETEPAPFPDRSVWEELVGSRLRVGGVEDELSLRVAEVGGRSDREFSVILEGPPDPVLPQRIWRLGSEQLGKLDVFIVPVGGDGTATHYEAVFNLAGPSAPTP